MKKPIERASGKQGKVHQGIRSNLTNAFAHTSQFGAFAHVDDSYINKKVRNGSVRLPNWSYDKKEQDKIMEEMSGEVRTYHISELEGRK